MKLRIKVLILICFIVSLLAILVGCRGDETPYTVNDELGYTVSVKYDANGGFFTTNTSVIVDSYNIKNMKQNSNGEAEIALLPPDDEARGTDAFTVTNNGYFLAGWYEVRNESKDSNGNTVYTYSNKWDFENDLFKVDASKEYSSKNPVLTLYAAWVPMFQIEFYDISNSELIETVTFNPTESNEFLLPTWNVETGVIDMNEFPVKKGYTFKNAYLDNAGSNLIEDLILVHPGKLNEENGTGKDSVLKVYLEFIEGDWFNIYNVDQFIKNASVSGNYIIHEDLDFTDKIWPTSFMHGNFTGTIQGNGHTFKNINFTQTNNAKVNSGLFGQLTDDAVISNLTFENITFTIQAGTRVRETNFGLFAGTLSDNANISDVTIKTSTIKIDSNCYFGADDYSIGLLCGRGDSTKVDYSQISCVATGSEPDVVTISVNGNEVEVVITRN